MEYTLLLSITAALVVSLFGILGWIGSRIVTKQDEILKKLDEVKDEMHSRINHVGIRLVKVETRLGMAQ